MVLVVKRLLWTICVHRISWGPANSARTSGRNILAGAAFSSRSLHTLRNEYECCFVADRSLVPASSFRCKPDPTAFYRGTACTAFVLVFSFPTDSTCNTRALSGDAAARRRCFFGPRQRAQRARNWSAAAACLFIHVDPELQRLAAATLYRYYTVLPHRAGAPVFVLRRAASRRWRPRCAIAPREEKEGAACVNRSKDVAAAAGVAAG